MLILNKNEYNEFILYLNENKTFSDPYYVFKFNDIYNRSTVVTLTDKSTATSYNQFQFTDSSDFSLYANGILYVYESLLDSSIIDASMNLLDSVDYQLISTKTTITFDPSIINTDIAFDPSASVVRTNEEFVFDPVWVSGDVPTLGIPASQIIQDSTHRFLTDNSINSYENITNIESFGLNIDGLGNVIVPGSKGYKSIGYNSIITGWNLLSDVSGNIKIDLKKGTFSEWPTLTSITNGNEPSLYNINKNYDNNLTGWDVSLNTGDIIEFTIDSSTTNITKIWLLINIRKI